MGTSHFSTSQSIFVHVHFGYSPPLTNLDAQTEFSQPQKIVAAHQRMDMACSLNG